MADARAGRPMLPILAEARSVEPARFYADAEPVLVGWVRELYGSGWQPTELIRIARTRAKAAGADLVRFAVAAERASRQGRNRARRWTIRSGSGSGPLQVCPGSCRAMAGR